MPTCRECNEGVAKLVTVKVLAEASEGAMQSMMGFKGRP
jgi:hypothetical protein